MKLGDKNEEVAQLQVSLAWLGYKVSVDGDFGPKTEVAVRAFQKDNFLAQDGIAGALTLQKIDDLVHFHVEAPLPELWTKDGWLAGTRRVPLHARRMGGVCKAAGCVVHSTDTFGGMAGILERWATEAGEFNGAHFLVGRRAATPEELASKAYPGAGTVQMAPVYRNANHAGGPGNKHGWIVNNRTQMHPNSWYVGIEIDNAGSLIKKGTTFVHKDSGHVVPNEEVFVDPKGRGWHKYTLYQFEQVGAIVDAVLSLGITFPTGSLLVSNGGYAANGVTWAPVNGLRVMTHVALDPIRKTDPGPEMTAYLNKRYR